MKNRNEKCRQWRKPILNKLSVSLTKAPPGGKQAQASETKNSAGQISFGGASGL